MDTSVLSDLIKIGIPSFVAIIGTLSTIIISLKSHKKDLMIEQLKYKNDIEKEKFTRVKELVQLCAKEITKLHAVLTSYTSYLYAKLDAEKDGEILEENAILNALDYRHDLIDAYSANITTQSYIFLIGDEILTKTFIRYYSSISEFTLVPLEEFNHTHFDALSTRMTELRDLHANIMLLLSNKYLHNEPIK